MTMTKFDFGKMLQSKLEQTSDTTVLSRWAYKIYNENIRELEPGLKNILLDLARMEDAVEFEYSRDELTKLAQALISGEQ